MIDFRHNVPIARVNDRGEVMMTLEFYQQLLELRGPGGQATPARTFYQASEPTGIWRDGDLWYDTDDEQRRTYRNVEGVATLFADQTEANRAAGLGPGATVSTGTNSVAAGMQPTTRQIADGDVLTWGPYSATPTLSIDPAPLPALSAGEQYELAITGASASGGTASLKKRTTGGTLTTQTGTTRTVVAADPGTVDVQKPTSGDSYNGSYRFTLSYDIEGREYGFTGPGESEPTDATLEGMMTVGVYYRTTVGGALTKAGDIDIYAGADGVVSVTGAAFTVSGFPAIGQHADPEFRLIVESRTFTGSKLTDVTAVAYETISGGTVSTATPSGNPKLTLRIDPR